VAKNKTDESFERDDTASTCLRQFHLEKTDKCNAFTKIYQFTVDETGERQNVFTSEM
jgi:hypothetical protein